MSSFFNKAYNTMSTANQAKMGSVGTKINSDGSHSVKIQQAYESKSKTGKPTFNVVFVDSEGKTAEWTAWLEDTVGKDAEGKVRAGVYTRNGVEMQMDDENDIKDNTYAMGHMKNLWKATGLDEAGIGTNIVQVSKTLYGEVQQVEEWKDLIGKEVTIVTSYEISAKAGGKGGVWRNQLVNSKSWFNKEGLSLAEVKNGVTDPISLPIAVKEAKANAKIKFSDKTNKDCIAELKAIKSVGKSGVPAVESKASDDSDDEWGE